VVCLSVCLSVQDYSASYGQVAMKFWKRVVLGTGNDYLDVSGSREPISVVTVSKCFLSVGFGRFCRKKPRFSFRFRFS